MYPYANFVNNASSILDLTFPCPIKKLKQYEIAKKIIIPQIDYDNFVTDLCISREFIEKNKSLCFVKDGVFHCLLVHRKNSKRGILVMSEGHDYPKWTATN